MSLLVEAAAFQGDRAPGSTIRFLFNTSSASGVPTTLTGTPVCSVYKDSNLTESTAGITLTIDFDSHTGLCQVIINTSADGTFYSGGSDFEVLLTSGTVGVIDVSGTTVGHFTLSKCTAVLADGVAHGGPPGSSTATLAMDHVQFIAHGNNNPLLIEALAANLEGIRIFADSEAAIKLLGFGGLSQIALASFHGIEMHANANGLVINSNGHAIELVPTDGDGISIEPVLSYNSTATGISVLGAGTGPSVQLGDGSIGAQALLALAGTGSGANMDAIKGVGQGTGAGFDSTPAAIGFGGGTVDANVVSYASGQDPATLLLDVAQSGHNTAGTIGADIGTAATGDANVVSVNGTVFSGPNVPCILADGVAHAGTPGSSTATIAFSRMVGHAQTTDTSAFSMTGDGTGAAMQLGDGSNGAEAIKIMAGIGTSAGILVQASGSSGIIVEGDGTNPDILLAGNSIFNGRIKIQSPWIKNQSLNGFTFLMVDSSDVPKPSLSVAAKRRLDGGSEVTCTNSVSELANGLYKIDLSAADMNANVVLLRFTATGAKDLDITIPTVP